MKSQDLKKLNLPDSPGVYYFLGPKKEILYIGKATSIKDRLKSYFARDILLTRGPLIEKMLIEAEEVKFTQTDSVLEALILEANEIKKYKPSANTKEKDDKSYNYVVFTKEDFPLIKTIRGRELKALNSSKEFKAVFGPFPNGSELKEALKIIRKIFPFRDIRCKLKDKPCFNAQIGLCPGPCAGQISKKEYAKIIKHLILFFEGKKVRLIKSLEKEMDSLAKKQKFEEAEKVKRQIFALDHIQDIALIRQDVERGDGENVYRIEAYDIAHLSGSNVVGVMTVVENGELAKSQYRKFKIRQDKNDDVGNLKEILTRRLGHLEWTLPNLIAVDGGVGQMNAANEILKLKRFNIEVVAVVKNDKHKASELVGKKTLINKWGKAVILANSEAHRFAIGYHRKLRNKGFRI